MGIENEVNIKIVAGAIILLDYKMKILIKEYGNFMGGNFPDWGMSSFMASKGGIPHPQKDKPCSSIVWQENPLFWLG